jgi:RNA polymerase sigma-70 factor (ECF subfamily)
MMTVLQNDLRNKNIKAPLTNMLDEIDHAELSQWLKAVAQTRDKQAFTHLFKFFAPKIQRIAQNKLSSEAQASDVVQLTMTNVWRKAHLFNESKGAATTWVYTVMRNVTFDLLRKVQSNKEDNLSDDIWPLIENESDDTFNDHLESTQLLTVIESLPESQQQVVKGFYLMEMSQEQLAEHLNVPVGTIKSRLRLALAKLKVQLGENND